MGARNTLERASLHLAVYEDRSFASRQRATFVSAAEFLSDGHTPVDHLLALAFLRSVDELERHIYLDDPCDRIDEVALDHLSRVLALAQVRARWEGQVGVLVEHFGEGVGAQGAFSSS